ncbi:MAG: OmpA family protein, partial [Ginsengibacter sp.]
ITDLKQNAMPAKIILDSNNTRVKQITFSPNSRQCFILDNYTYNYPYNLKIYNIGNIEPEIVPNIVAAQFTQQGNYIITIDRGGAIVVWDSIGRATKFNPAILEYNDITKYLNQLKSISLSPDWKKIIFKQDTKISILEREEGDSVISSSYPTYRLKLNSEYSSPDKTLINTASFIDKNSILAVNNNGKVLLWKTYPDFQNTSEALKNIQLPDLTITEKLEDTSLTFDAIKLSENEHDLREAATYFERNYNSGEDYGTKNNDSVYNYANKLYRKLIGKTSGEKKLYYVNKFMLLNRSFTSSKSPDVAKQKKIAGRLNENVELLKDETKNYPDNGVLRKELSNDCNELAYHQLFIKQYQKVIETCNTGLEADPTNKIIYTNLALGYLLSGNFPQAAKYYELYKDSTFGSGSQIRTFKDGFLQDFDDFTYAKVIKEEDKDVYDKVQEIREMLGGVAPVKNNNQYLSKAAGNKTIGTILGAVIGGSAGAIIGHDMDKQAEEIKNDIPGVKVERVEEGIRVEFNEKILFAFSKTDFGDSAKASLNNLVAVLNKYPNTNIEIQGHTDSRGNDEYNMELSQKRAGTFADYLKAQGVTESRITTKGYGESAPAYTNDTDEGMAQNRRVEFLITANDQMKEDAKKQANQ